jgi:hypothetical protein
LDLYNRMKKIFFGPLPQDVKIFRGIASKVMGAKKIFNACSGLPTHRHNYFKMLEFANEKIRQNQLPLMHTLRVNTL